MKTIGRLGLLATSIACIAALILSTWPGLLGSVLVWAFVLAFMLTLTVGPILVICALIGAGIALWKRPVGLRRLSSVRLPWKHASIACFVAFATAVLVVLQAPTRLGFAIAQPSLERLATNAPVFDGSFNSRSALDRWYGPFRIDSYAADERGGIYFRTHHENFMSIDTTSFGFAYQPNPKGTPFGGADYFLTKLWGDWYVFQACDDWY